LAMNVMWKGPLVKFALTDCAGVLLTAGAAP
jgi:hypothetical protein